MKNFTMLSSNKVNDSRVIAGFKGSIYTIRFVDINNHYHSYSRNQQTSILLD